MTRSISILIILVTVLGGTAAASRRKIAVLPLEAEADSGQPITPETRALAAELTVAFQLRAQSSDGPFVLVTAPTATPFTASALATCRTELPSCMAPIGVHVGAALLMYGTVRQVGTRYLARVVLLDVETKRKLRTVANFELADAAAGPIEAGPIASKLSKQLYPKLWLGGVVSTIVVTAGLMEASLTVDGRPVGDLMNGVARLPHYPKGSYVVALTTRGRTTKQTVTIGEDGEDVIVSFQLAVPKTDGR